MRISELPAKVAGDPLAQAVKTVVDVMRTDFGERFARAFADAEQVRQLKRRLYAKLKGLAVCDIIDGYDDLVATKPAFVPSVPEIVEAVLCAQKARLKAEREASEARRIAALPPSPEISESAAKQNLAKIRALLSDACADMGKRETEGERQARLKRLDDKVAAHEALLDQAFPHRGKPRMVETHHECAVGWCMNPGTLSHSTNGGSFFCREHFKPSGE